MIDKLLDGNYVSFFFALWFVFYRIYLFDRGKISLNLIS